LPLFSSVHYAAYSQICIIIFSLELGKTGTATSSQVATYMFTAWGQFMTHDMIQTPDVGGGKVPCSCTPHNSCKNIKIDKSKEQVLEFPCMFVIRSSSKLGQENGRPVREQINQLSSFIDGTTVYGFTTRHKNLLLAPDKMHLRMRSNKNGDFLPNVKDINNKEVTASFQTADVFNDKGHDEFVAGDTRVLENPVLSSFHTMFARLHNVAVDEMVKLNPTWKSTRVFEEARLYGEFKIEAFV
jgi:peroxidase